MSVDLALTCLVSVAYWGSVLGIGLVNAGTLLKFGPRTWVALVVVLVTGAYAISTVGSYWSDLLAGAMFWSAAMSAVIGGVSLARTRYHRSWRTISLWIVGAALVVAASYFYPLFYTFAFFVIPVIAVLAAIRVRFRMSWWLIGGAAVVVAALVFSFYRGDSDEIDSAGETPVPATSH